MKNNKHTINKINIYKKHFYFIFILFLFLLISYFVFAFILRDFYFLFPLWELELIQRAGLLSYILFFLPFIIANIYSFD